MSEEARFFKRIQGALEDAALRRGEGESLFPTPDPFLTWSDYQQARLGAGDQEQPMLSKLMEAAAANNMPVIEKHDPAAVGDAIVDLALGRPGEWSAEKSIVAWDHPLIRELTLNLRLKPHGLTLTVVPSAEEMRNAASGPEFRKTLERSLIGVTSADFCLADTATLVMKTRPGCARSVSLLPSIHVAVIRRHQILPDLRSLICRLAEELNHDPDSLSNCLTWISGPSKTADIEATLVFGAHGPREVYLFILP